MFSWGLKMKLNGILLQIFLAVLTLISCLVIGELSIRAVQYFRHNISPLTFSTIPPTLAFDRTLGWKVVANQHRTLTDGDRTVLYSTGPHGFRLYGNTNSTNTKIMIVGDSFTDAIQVSDDQTYYANLKKIFSEQMSSPPEIFAYGAIGYGTLQEVMIVERYIEQIAPDILILQVCSNDFINNSFELESASYYNNNHMLRPYLGSDGSIAMQLPQMVYAASYSRFLQWLIIRSNNFVVVNKLARGVEEDIEHQPAHPAFLRAVALTDRLLERLRSVVPAATKIYAFNVDNLQPYSGTFEKLFARHGIIYIEGVPEAITDAFRKGDAVYASDGAHWAPPGHRIAAEVLANGLRLILG
jgi:hypothetical protein